jgi:hypothetical protein
VAKKWLASAKVTLGRRTISVSFLPSSTYKLVGHI